MSTNNDELVIDLPTDEITVKPDGNAAPAADSNLVVEDGKKEDLEVNSGAQTPEDAIDSIKKDLDAALRRSEEKTREATETSRQLQEERAKREKIEGELANTTDKAFRAHYQAVTSEHQQILNGIHATKQEMDAAKIAYRTAFEAGDANAAAAAQERISLAATDLRTLENGKAGAELAVREAESYWRAKQNAPKPEPKTETQPQRQQTPDDWIGQVRNVFGTKPAEWLEKNRQFVTDPKLNQKLLKFADYYREVEEKPLDSQDFIRALNQKFLGEKVSDDEVKPNGSAPQKKPAIASAPPSRGGDYFNSRNLNAGKIRLPSDLARFCDEAGLNKTTYAQSLVQLIKEGKLPKEYLDEGYNRSL